MNEAKRIMADRLFHELDLDHDGHVTKTEVNTSHTQQQQWRGDKIDRPKRAPCKHLDATLSVC